MFPKMEGTSLGMGQGFGHLTTWVPADNDWVCLNMTTSLGPLSLKWMILILISHGTSVFRLWGATS